MSTDNETKQKLQAPFEPEDIEWRIQQSGLKNSKPWAMVIPYITNRAIQKRLDDVFGIFGWENVFEQTTPTITNKKTNKKIVQKTVYGWRCGITIHLEGKSVTKWDGAEETDIEPLKGGISNSMKRSAVQLGIGRYLYQLEPVFAICVPVNSRRDCNEEYPNYQSIKEKNTDAWVNFVWGNPPLPKWALPGIDFDEFLQSIRKAPGLIELKNIYSDAYRKAQATGNEYNIESAIQAKDKRKAELEQKLVNEKEQNHKSVVAWMNKQIAMLDLIPNESAVEQVYKTTIKPVLIDKSKAFCLDEKPLLKTLKTAYDLRIKELQPPKRDEKQ